jgi:hypothetical protein
MHFIFILSAATKMVLLLIYVSQINDIIGCFWT